MSEDSIVLRGHELYVRATRDRTMESLARSAGAFDGLGVQSESPFCVVMWRDFRPPEELMRSLSGELSTDVLWLVWQKQVDAFAFQHWKDGVAGRRLAYGVLEKERTWELVFGSPEPWEEQAFFSAKRLQRRIDNVTRYPYPGSPSETDLRRIWSQQLIEVDSGEPSLNGLDAAYVVARHYRLPGFVL